ncbi:MAG: TIGR02281 family clan AA aspartic protease [Stappiaceae bacterium]
MPQYFTFFVAVIVAAIGFPLYFEETQGQWPSVGAQVDSKPQKIAKVSNERGRKVRLKGDRRGHYLTEARINNRSMQVMVDTGASMVAIPEEDARRFGFSGDRSKFTGKAHTANGVARVAPITLDEVRIGNIRVRNVRAAVIERGRLDVTLLGMTFLNRLDSVSIEDNTLVMKQ